MLAPKSDSDLMHHALAEANASSRCFTPENMMASVLRNAITFSFWRCGLYANNVSVAMTATATYFAARQGLAAGIEKPLNLLTGLAFWSRLLGLNGAVDLRSGPPFRGAPERLLCQFISTMGR